MSTPPSYSVKTNQPMIDEHYPQVPYPNPPPLPNVNPPLATVGNYPMACICPYCRQTVVTRTEKDAGVLVWVSAAVICVFGCFCGCCLIPFCIDDMKDTIHYCPNCNHVIAKNKIL